MSRLFIIGVLLSSLAAAPAFAQVVDPCQYGCPKEGCPQCDDGGGPIEEDDGSDPGDEPDEDEGEDTGEDDSDDLPA